MMDLEHYKQTKTSTLDITIDKREYERTTDFSSLTGHERRTTPKVSEKYQVIVSEPATQ
jgi:hypothetical protein